MPDGGAPEIVCLIKRVDHVMLRHRLKQFYTDPHPHVSLLWWSGDIKETVQRHLDKFEQIWAASVGCWCCQVRSLVRCCVSACGQVPEALHMLST